jgi:anthranilate/para-aminobenzoate synthase component II
VHRNALRWTPKHKLTPPSSYISFIHEMEPNNEGAGMAKEWQDQHKSWVGLQWHPEPCCAHWPLHTLQGHPLHHS